MSELYRWKPHRAAPYLVLQGHTDAVVRTVQSPNGKYLWEYAKRFGYEATIEDAKASNRPSAG